MGITVLEPFNFHPYLPYQAKKELFPDTLPPDDASYQEKGVNESYAVHFFFCHWKEGSHKVQKYASES